MNANWSGRLSLVVVVALTGAGFLVWLAGLLPVWLRLRTARILSDFSTNAETLSTAMAVAIVVGAGFLAYLERSKHLPDAQTTWLDDTLWAIANSLEVYYA